MAIKIYGDTIPLSQIQEAKEQGKNGVNIVAMKDLEAEVSINDLQDQLNKAIITMTQMILMSGGGDNPSMLTPPIPPME